MVGGMSTIAEEFDPKYETWTSIPVLQRFAHLGLSSALEVPAELFANKPGAGGCTGVS